MTKFTGNILALDLATVTGWAHGKPGDAPRSGSLRFGSTDSSRAECYRTYRAWLAQTIKLFKIDLVVFESPSMSVMHGGKTNVHTLKKLIGFAEHTEEFCYGLVELREANIAQVRAHFIGTTRLKRDEAKKATKAKCLEYGWVPEDDNAADALAVWAYQVSCLRPDVAQAMTPLFSGRSQLATR